jgi:type IV pilus assembly protein PilQ
MSSEVSTVNGLGTNEFMVSMDEINEKTTVENDGLEDLSSSEHDAGLLSLDFEDTDIRDVVRVLAEISGLNMIVGPDIDVRVDVQLKDVTWQQALDVILKTYNLTYKQEENLIRIMTLDQMRVEEEKVPLETRIVYLNFAKAEEIQPSLEKMLSPRGSIQTYIRTNSLIITDLPENTIKIEKVANQLDTRTPQVMIEALMADVTLTNEERLGIDWDIKHPDDFYETTMSQSLQFSEEYSAVIQFGKTLFRKNELDMLIEMWKKDERVDVLANPKIMTLDNLQATIALTEEEPYTQTTTTDQGTVTSTAFKETGIKLFVTPHITTKDNWISMNVQVEQSFKSGTVGGEPVVDSRTAETNLMVRDGETIVIGGLRRRQDQVTLDKVPILGDIPILGAVFRRTLVDKKNIDLLIFITTTIITEPILNAREEATFEVFKEEREDQTGVGKKVLQKMQELERQREIKQREKAVELRSAEPSLDKTLRLRPPGKED